MHAASLLKYQYNLKSKEGLESVDKGKEEWK